MIENTKEIPTMDTVNALYISSSLNPARMNPAPISITTGHVTSSGESESFSDMVALSVKSVFLVSTVSKQEHERSARMGVFCTPCKVSEL